MTSSTSPSQCKEETIEQRAYRMQAETLAWTPDNPIEENDRRVLLKVFDYLITGVNANTRGKDKNV